MKLKLSQISINEDITDLRPIDMFVVERYRQAIRTGAEFPPIVVAGKGYGIVSGNHRYTAYLAELGEDAEVEVVRREFKTRRDMLEFAAGENMKHGSPMTGITRRRFALAIAAEGASLAEVARLFNVPERTLELWGTRVVRVFGKGKGRDGTTQPIKFGPDLETGQRVTSEQYTTHIKRDMGASGRQMALQLARWLRAGWIDMTDERTAAAMDELRAALGTVEG